MGTAGAAETFFIAASTDLDKSGIMTMRIREQLERVPGLKSRCTVTIMAAQVDLPIDLSSQPLDDQVLRVANIFTEMIKSSVERKQSMRGNQPYSSN
jgi:hypothetical protein